jgi:HNH endonuclease
MARLGIKNRRGQTFTVLHDDEKQDAVDEHTWHVGHGGYAATNVRDENGKQKTVFMHRLLMGFPEQVDHINGNRLDNRMSNLRACTQVQNRYNHRVAYHSTSGYKGVTPSFGKWRVTVGSPNVPGNVLGRFADIREAAHVYDMEAIRRYGEFASPNFPDIIGYDVTFTLVNLNTNETTSRTYVRRAAN